VESLHWLVNNCGSEVKGNFWWSVGLALTLHEDGPEIEIEIGRILIIDKVKTVWTWSIPDLQHGSDTTSNCRSPLLAMVILKTR